MDGKAHSSNLRMNLAHHSLVIHRMTIIDPRDEVYYDCWLTLVDCVSIPCQRQVESGQRTASVWIHSHRLPCVYKP